MTKSGFPKLKAFESFPRSLTPRWIWLLDTWIVSKRNRWDGRTGRTLSKIIEWNPVIPSNHLWLPVACNSLDSFVGLRHPQEPGSHTHWLSFSFFLFPHLSSLLPLNICFLCREGPMASWLLHLYNFCLYTMLAIALTLQEFVAPGPLFACHYSCVLSFRFFFFFIVVLGWNLDLPRQTLYHWLHFCSDW